MDDVELRSVTLVTPLNRKLEKSSDYVEKVIETEKFGKVVVATRGNPKKPAIVTYHDLGLNYISNYQAFFNYPDMAEVVEQFYVCHINAPGQEEGAPTLPDSFTYPSMDELAEQINEVINQLKIARYVGIGVGLGGNVLLRHAREYPERVDSLLLVSTLPTAPGWIEWGYQKRNISQMCTHGMTQSVCDYLMWHHLGLNYDLRAHDLVNVFRDYFANDINPKNLAKLAEQYIWRTTINIDREYTNSIQSGDSKTIQVPILNLCGIYSPFIEETVTLNGKLNPKNASWMKVQDCAMCLEEQPGKVAEAFRLFMQGQGYCLNIRKTSIVGIVN